MVYVTKLRAHCLIKNCYDHHLSITNYPSTVRYVVYIGVRKYIANVPNYYKNKMLNTLLKVTMMMIILACLAVMIPWWYVLGEFKDYE